MLYQPGCTPQSQWLLSTREFKEKETFWGKSGNSFRGNRRQQEENNKKYGLNKTELGRSTKKCVKNIKKWQLTGKKKAQPLEMTHSQLSKTLWLWRWISPILPIMVCTCLITSLTTADWLASHPATKPTNSNRYWNTTRYVWLSLKRLWTTRRNTSLRR